MESGIDLRMHVIECTIELERIASQIMREAWHLPNATKETMTLGHKSSSISFKSKMDILHDFGSISKDQYEDLKSLAEIRNQFAHNYEATSWVILKSINSDLLRRLKKHTSGIEDEESALHYGYTSLYGDAYALLTELEKNYQYQNYQIAIDYARSQSQKNFTEVYKNTVNSPEISELDLSDDALELLLDRLTKNLRIDFLDRVDGVLSMEAISKTILQREVQEVTYSTTIRLGNEFI